jgi:hypothetical protein
MCNERQRHSLVVSQPTAPSVVLAAMIVMMSALTSQTGAAALDNSWTTGGYPKNQGSQSVRTAALTTLGSFRVESSEKGSPPPATLFSFPAEISSPARGLWSTFCGSTTL